MLRRSPSFTLFPYTTLFRSVSLKISVGGRRAQRAHFPGNPTFKHLNAQGGRADGAVAARYIIVPQAAPISLTRANQGDLRSGGGVHCGATKPVLGAWN